METEALIGWGGSVKALERDGDRLKVGGYVVLFGGPGDLSSKRDIFTKSTDFGLEVANRGRVRWHHGIDPKVGRRILGVVEAKTDLDDVGVWAEGWIAAADDYGRKIAGWVAEGKAGWSTSALPHMVDRKELGDGRHEITEWPMGGGDWTITLTPADPRQLGQVCTLKSLPTEPGAAAAPSLMDDLSRLATEAEALLPVVESALKSRLADGRNLSAGKLASLKAAHAGLGRLIDMAEAPARAAAARKALRRSMLAALIAEVRT